MHPNANLVKVDLPSELFATERLFATPLGGDYYRLESIPFRIPSISFHDVVEATIDNEREERRLFKRLIQKSGFGTLWVDMGDALDQTEIQILLDDLHRLGCAGEGVNSRYFAMTINAKSDRVQAENLLDNWGVIWLYGDAPWLFEASKEQEDFGRGAALHNAPIRGA